MKKLLCRLGIFEGVYVKFCDNGDDEFRLVRYDKEGNRYIIYSSARQYLCENGSTKGRWKYLIWSANPINKQEPATSWFPFWKITKTIIPFKEEAKEIQGIDFNTEHPAPYSWR